MMVHRAASFASVAALLLVALAPACGDATLDAIVGAPGDSAGGDAGAHGDGAGIGDGASGFCAGAGPLVQLPQGVCTGDIGMSAFPFAVCSCTTASISGVLRTDSFNSLGGPTSGNHGTLGATGALTSNAMLDVKGSLWARGDGAPTAMKLSNQGTIGGEAHAGGPLVVDGTFRETGDVFAAGGTTQMSGQLTTNGRLHVPQGATTGGVTASGGIVNEPVSVAPPCDCSAPLDIGGVVSSFAGSNDDAIAGLTRTSLTATTGQTVALPCGRFYFDAIGGAGVTLKLTGRTALFVAGDVSVTQALNIDLGPSAEVDLFVAGNFSINGSAMFGSTTAPARVRVYVGGASVSLSGTAGIGANVYAPHAAIAFASAFVMSGALFGNRVALSGDFTIHYDEAILDVQGCRPPAGACNSCHDCSGATPACKNGTCAPCTSDADCCAPLQCHSGACTFIIK